MQLNDFLVHYDIFQEEECGVERSKDRVSASRQRRASAGGMAYDSLNFNSITLINYIVTRIKTSYNNLIYDTPSNDFDSRYYHGGSSSGYTYAISTGLIPITLGAPMNVFDQRIALIVFSPTSRMFSGYFPE